jgi:hypothetical protein
MRESATPASHSLKAARRSGRTAPFGSDAGWFAITDPVSASIPSTTEPTPMQVNLTWQVIDDDHIALVFGKPVWELFRARATERGTLAPEMIADAVADLLSPFVTCRWRITKSA